MWRFVTSLAARRYTHQPSYVDLFDQHSNAATPAIPQRLSVLTER